MSVYVSLFHNMDLDHIEIKLNCIKIYGCRINEKRK